MSKRQILMLIGVWVLLLAAPGFPPGWKGTLLFLTGVGIIIFGYRMKAPEGAAPMESPKADLPFTDSKITDQKTDTTHVGPVA